MPFTITATVPAAIPRWASGGGAVVTAPTAAKQDSGWVGTEKPPAATFNWLSFYTYLYLVYLQSATDQLDAGKLALNGSQDITGILRPDGNVTRDLGTPTRYFASGYIAALNSNSAALGNATATTMGVSGSLSGGTTTVTDLISSGDIYANGTLRTDLIPKFDGTQNLGSATFRYGGARIRSLFSDSVTFTNVNAATDPVNNKLTSRLVPKAWAAITTDGVGGVTLVAGANISSVALTGTVGAKILQVNFASPMGNGNYAVTANAMSKICDVACNGKLPAYTNVAAYAVGTTTAFGLDNRAANIDIHVFGEQ